MMHAESFSTRYQPTSPLSPRMSPGLGSLSPPTTRNRNPSSKQSARGFRLELPAYPSMSPRMSTSSTSQTPAITLNRGTQPTPMDSPWLMREKQKELIARAQLSSKLAASPMTAKPDAPRLDPLGSPKGAVTPLNLETEAPDYFTVAAGGRFTPSPSPGIHSSRSSGSSGKEEKMKKRQS